MASGMVLFYLYVIFQQVCTSWNPKKQIAPRYFFRQRWHCCMLENEDFLSRCITHLPFWSKERVKEEHKEDIKAVKPHSLCSSSPGHHSFLPRGRKFGFGHPLSALLPTVKTNSEHDLSKAKKSWSADPNRLTYWPKSFDSFPKKVERLVKKVLVSELCQLKFPLS